MALRRNRLLRLHMKDNHPTVEGIGPVRTVAGHYRLHSPKLIQAEDQTMSLSGELAVPAENVLMVQVLR